MPREGNVEGGELDSCSDSGVGASATGFGTSSSLEDASSEDSFEDEFSSLGFGISEMVSRLNEMISLQYEFPH